MAGRPKNAIPTSTLAIRITPKLKRYLDDLVLEEGYGGSPPDVARTLLWRAIEDLVAKGILDRRAGVFNQSEDK